MNDSWEIDYSKTFDRGSMGKFGSADDFFDSIEAEETLNRAAFGANRLTERFNKVISNEFLEIDTDSILIINLVSINLICSACMMISEEKREEYFDGAVQALKSIFLEYKKIPPSKH